MRKIFRVLLSRYTVSAVMIVLEVIVFAYLCAHAVSSLLVASIISIVASLAALVSLITRDTNPEYKIPWAVIIIVIPVLGPVLYMLFYKRRMTRREGRFLEGLFGEIKPYGAKNEALESLADRDTSALGKARAILVDDPIASVYQGTSSEFFSSGEEYFSRMEEDLISAQEYIFFEYFIIDQGELWDRIHGILREKAAKGVDIRVLYDDIGCMKTLPANYEERLTREGIKAKRFAKVSPRLSSGHHNRDHRKICIIDGRAAYTGGVNIADEYVNIKQRFGHWRDGGIRVTGDAVLGLLKLFLSSWDFTAGKVSEYERIFSSVKTAENPDDGYYIPFGSGPAPLYKRSVGKNTFLNIINQSQRYVYITTPYLIIDYDLTEAICNAALRGVDVKIVTPGIADKKMVKIMTKSSYPYLIDAGVRIYEYTPGFIHEKTVISDDLYAVIGTINFDYRSLVHHFEDAVWIYNSPTVISAKDSYTALLSKCTQTDAENSKLSFIEWIFRNLIRLFAPLL